MNVSQPRTDISAYLIDPVRFEKPAPISWSELFGNSQPTELEIGSGKGLFLSSSAAAVRNHNFLGVELARKYARLAAERLARRELSNAKIWRGDAKLVIAGAIPGNSLRAVHVYFPDPWWKKRHKKRRVFTEDLLAHVERTLEPGGDLKIASDVEEYFTKMTDLVAANHRFKSRPALDLDDPARSIDHVTNFERKYRIEGRMIFRAHYVLQ